MEDALRLSVAEVKVLRKDYAELYEQFKQLAAHATTLQQQNDAVVKKNESMKRRLREYESTRKTFEDDVLHLQMASRLLEKREADVEETLSSLRENLLAQRGMTELLEKENEDLKTMMATEHIHIDAHKKLIDKNDEDFKLVTKRNELLMSDIENNYVRKDEFVAALAQLDSVSSEKLELEKRLAASHRKEIELSISQKAYTDQLSVAQTELAVAQTKLIEAAKFQDRHTNCEEIHRVDVEKLMQSEAAKASLLTQLGNEKMVARRERDAIKPYQDQLQDYKSRIDELQRDNERLRGELVRQQDSVASKTQELDELKINFSKSQEQANILLGQKIEAENLCEELYGKRTEMETELVRVKEENLSLHRKILDTAPELEYLRSQLDEFRNAVLMDLSSGIDALIASPSRLNALDFVSATYGASASPTSPSFQPTPTAMAARPSRGTTESNDLFSEPYRTRHTAQASLNGEAFESQMQSLATSVGSIEAQVLPLTPHELQSQQRLHQQLAKQEEEFASERRENRKPEHPDNGSYQPSITQENKYDSDSTSGGPDSHNLDDGFASSQGSSKVWQSSQIRTPIDRFFLDHSSDRPTTQVGSIARRSPVVVMPNSSSQARGKVASSGKQSPEQIVSRNYRGSRTIQSNRQGTSSEIIQDQLEYSPNLSARSLRKY